MTWSLLAHTQKRGNSGITTDAIDTTGADLLAVYVQYWDGGAEPTLTDNKSNTWAQLTLQIAESNVPSRLYYATNVAGLVGSGHTFHLDAGNLQSLSVQAWSGAHLTAPFRDQSGAHSDPNATSATLAASIGAAGDLLVVGCAFDIGTSPGISGGTFTSSDSASFDSSFYGVLMGYDSNSGAGVAAAENPTVSWTTSADWSICGASFKPAAAASGSIFTTIAPKQFGRMQYR